MEGLVPDLQVAKVRRGNTNAGERVFQLFTPSSDRLWASILRPRHYEATLD